jgi:hypothetical protein
MIRAAQSDHGVAMQEGRERGLVFVRWARRRHEINCVNMEAFLRGLRNRDVTGMDGIERAAKKRNRTAMRVSVRPSHGVRSQQSSRRGAA